MRGHRARRRRRTRGRDRGSTRRSASAATPARARSSCCAATASSPTHERQRSSRPLLLPDAPVVAWWPRERARRTPAEDLDRAASRTAGSPTRAGQAARRKALEPLAARLPARRHRPGLDPAHALAGLLAAALDQPPYEPVDHRRRSAAPRTPPAPTCWRLAGRVAALSGAAHPHHGRHRDVERAAGAAQRQHRPGPARRPGRDALQPGQPERRIGLPAAGSRLPRRGAAPAGARRDLRGGADQGAGALAHTKTKTESAAIAEGEAPSLVEAKKKVATAERAASQASLAAKRAEPAAKKAAPRKAGSKSAAAKRGSTKAGSRRPSGPRSGEPVAHGRRPPGRAAARRGGRRAPGDPAGRRAELARQRVDRADRRGMGSALLTSLAASPARDAIDWSRLDVWWGDERFLPQGHPDRNETQNRAALLDQVPLDPARVHAMPGPDGPDGDDVDAAAASYADALARAASGGEPTPIFDVLMLGVGPDAHVASLFPEAPALYETERTAVGVRNSPKPPPTRISLTMPVLRPGRGGVVPGGRRGQGGRRRAGAVGRRRGPGAGRRASRPPAHAVAGRPGRGRPCRPP